MDLTKVPFKDLKSEYMRRLNKRRRTNANAGRKPKLKKCKHCSQKFSVVEMRKHTPRCAANPTATKVEVAA